MMRIGIITFHRAINYGAALQCWALQKYLEKTGNTCCVIDYRCENVERTYKILNLKEYLRRNGLKSKMGYLLSRLRHWHNMLLRNNAFKKFQESSFNLSETSNIRNIDAIIAGSDQIWNPQLTGGVDDVYILKNDLFDSVRKIAYAVSGEDQCFTERDINIIKGVLGEFYAVSFREESLARLFGQRYNDYEVCIDPTMLLKASDYEEIVSDRMINGQYLFLYQVVPSQDAVLFAKRVARERGLQFVFLNSKFDFFTAEKNIKEVVGPREFLSLIKYASLVITTSFHGLAFSIIYKRQFCYFKSGKTSRQENLLKQLSLEYRIVNKKGLCSKDVIDYDNINVETISERSKLFIDKCLKENE